MAGRTLCGHVVLSGLDLSQQRSQEPQTETTQDAVSKAPMNNRLTFLLALLALCPAAANAECVAVLWIPFDAELYSPESEATIEERAFERTSIPLAMAKRLSPADASSSAVREYDPHNTRALIKVRDKPFFIDRFGWTRQGEHYGKIAISQIEDALSSSCSDAP